MEIIFTSAFFAALLFAAVYFWRYTLCAVALFAFTALLMASCSRAATVAQLVVITDTQELADSAAVADAINEAAYIYQSQAGIQLDVVRTVVANPATHTNPYFLLDALKAYKVDQKAGTADVYVMFTARKLAVGDQRVAGIATTGPACSADASVVVSVQFDGTDGVTLAHELAHTFGADHDAQPGYLMAETNVGTSTTMSPDTLGVIRGAYLDCMAPSPAPAASVAAPPTGGGGSFDLGLLAALAITSAMVLFGRMDRAQVDDSVKL